MLVSDYNYNLPDECIAKEPPKTRGTTRLLVLDKNNGNITDSRYAKLADFLEPGDLVILNDTRVMRARLFAKLPNDHPRELVVLEKHKSDLNSVMYHGKLRAGDILTILTERDGEKTEDTVTIREILGNGTATVSSSRPLVDIVEDHGSVPLPPYLHRDATPEDIKRYQTVWAKQLGSAAAPTASPVIFFLLAIAIVSKNLHRLSYLHRLQLGRSHIGTNKHILSVSHFQQRFSCCYKFTLLHVFLQNGSTDGS